MTNFNPKLGYEYLDYKKSQYDSYGSAYKFKRAVNNAVASGVTTFEGFVDIYKRLGSGFISVDPQRLQSFKKWLLKEKGINVQLREGDLDYKPIQDKGVKFDVLPLSEVRTLISGLSDRPAQVFYLLASCGLTVYHIENFSRLDGNNFHLRNGHIFVLSDDEAQVVAGLLNDGEFSKMLFEYFDDSKDKHSEKLNGLWNYLYQVSAKDSFPYSFYEVLRIWELNTIMEEGPGEAFPLISQRIGTAANSIKKRWVCNYPGKRISHKLADKLFY